MYIKLTFFYYTVNKRATRVCNYKILLNYDSIKQLKELFKQKFTRRTPCQAVIKKNLQKCKEERTSFDVKKFCLLYVFVSLSVYLFISFLLSSSILNFFIVSIFVFMHCFSLAIACDIIFDLTVIAELMTSFCFMR